MKRQPVTSSNLKSVGWDNGTLEVEFHSGGVYQYSNVPASKHAALMAEDARKGGSVGAHFIANIKTKHGHKKISA